MRINAYVALATGLSRRQADNLIQQGKVSVNSQIAKLGMQIVAGAKVTLDGKVLAIAPNTTTIMLNKPAGYVVSRKGQGAKTLYDLLPKKYHVLKPIGRLDKDSSGLILLSNDGLLANNLTHPSQAKIKRYIISLDKPLSSADVNTIRIGVKLSDGISRLGLSDLSANARLMSVSMGEGRNRQIRRSFAALGYKVVKLHRVEFGQFSLDKLASGDWLEVKP